MDSSTHYEATAYDSRIPYTPIRESKKRWMPHRDNGGVIGSSLSHNTHLTSATMSAKELRQLERNASADSFNTKSPLHNLPDNELSDNLAAINHDHLILERGGSTFQNIVLLILDFPARLVLFLLPAALILTIGTEDPIISVRSAVLTSIFCLVVIGVATLLRRLIGLADGDKRRALAIFFRSTGLVYYFPTRTGPPVVKPFTEYDGILLRIRPSEKGGQSSYALHFSHRQDRKLHFSLPGSGSDSLEPGIYWSWLRQFMDVSRPLPDTPEFEPFRHLDPTTAEYDQEHPRPKRFYRDMSDATLIELCDQSLQARRPAILSPTINSIYDLLDEVDYIPHNPNEEEAAKTINNRMILDLSLKNYPKIQLFLVTAALILRGLFESS